MDEALRPIMFGLILLMVAFFVQRRTWKKRAQMGKVDPLEVVEAEAHKIDQHHRNEMSRLQTKLHDFERTVDGKIGTRFAQLEELLRQADQEIARLHQELAQVKGESSSLAQTRFSAQQVSMIQHLAESGYSETEIAELTEFTATEIQTCLSDHQNDAA